MKQIDIESPFALRDMPDEEKTEELCLEAVKRNGWAIAWAGRFAASEAVRLAAVQQAGDVLGRIPEELRSPAVCEAAVRQSPSALRHVPDELMTLGLCLLACAADAGAYIWVPADFRDEVAERLHGSAVNRLAGHNAPRLPSPYVWDSEKFCREIVRRNPRAVRWVPECFRAACDSVG